VIDFCHASSPLDANSSILETVSIFCGFKLIDCVHTQPLSRLLH
jgi:hypothetical protein